ncbi:hypothetical protein DN068_10890 [Taibaiella soli]|uniref:GNAT family N-acetyltransferase n=1 Tax=Taibaiella soli TaxID=1649169 RepID=A0A2W2B9H0_9BACT|nr:hypothetical protein DN068_10890 [Taibaiella soli]
MFESTDDLPAAWNAMLPTGHFLRKEQLVVNEAAQLPDVQFLYGIILRQKKPVALVYFQVLCLQDYHVNKEGIKAWQFSLWNSFTTVTRPKLLVAGHLFRHDIASFYAIPLLSSYEAFLCYNEAINAALYRSKACAVLVKDMPEKLVTYFQHFAPQYLLLRNDISMEMILDESWQTFKDYEASLKHKYAQRVRKLRQNWDSLKVRELNFLETENCKTELYALYRQVSNKQQIRLGLLNEDFLPLLKKHNGDALKIWAVYEEEKMIAFLSAWIKGDDFDMFYIGFDYDRNTALNLYFNILYFSVEQAILHRKKQLILGRTALDAKARLGCQPRYLSTFIFIKNSLLRNYIIRAQQRLTADEGSTWENKHPFKKDS